MTGYPKQSTTRKRGPILANFPPVARLTKSFQSLWQAVRCLPLTWQACFPLAAIILLVWNTASLAQGAPPSAEEQIATLKVGLDTVWVLVASILVIFMNAGFCMLETGFCRQKNAVNVLSKNLIVFALATVAFWAIGFGLMFGDGNPFVGTSGFFLAGPDSSPLTGDAYKQAGGIFGSLSWAGVPLAAKFIFQVAFAGTAATIVSGAVAERIKFVDFLIFSLLLVGIAYAVTGHWIWGGGWLATLGFWDFAGSTVVHSVGGWAALVGAAILGPRIGKYRDDGSAGALPGHNLSIATLGCLILWIGWFGFNPGSTMSVGDGSAMSHIFLVTNLAGAVGGIAATITSWVISGKPDLSMTINGILAGLVAVTASCAWVGTWSSAIIGLIGGVLVVFGVFFFDSIKVDDPVGATSVHLINGIWGTLAVGLFSEGDKYGSAGPANGLFFGGGFTQLWHQFVGVAAVGGFTVLFSFIAWYAIQAVLGMRVTEEEEMIGLDISEHGMEAYSGFTKDLSVPGSAPVSSRM